MRTIAKLILGILTLLPGAYLLIILAGVVEVSFDRLSHLHDAAMALTLVLAGFYVLHGWTNHRLSRQERWLWIVLLVFAGFLSQSVYFWRYVWREVGGVSLRT
jgi:chromate transport protein ChrA